ELERRRGELLAERETLARAQNALKLLILADTDEALWLDAIDPTDSAAVNVVPVDVQASLRRALSARAELDAARAALDRRRAETSLARHGVWPSLDVVVSYYRIGLDCTRISYWLTDAVLYWLAS